MSESVPSAATTPTRDQDIFGNELGLTAGERSLLSQAGRIFLKKVLQVDTHSKKGDPTEPKTLVISSSRCYVLSQGATPKVEISFNFLRIHQIDCTEKKLTFNLAGDPRPRMFHSARADSIQITGLITAQLKNVFPITQLDLIIKTNFESDSLCSSVGNLRDNLLSAMDRVDATTISGFLTSYGFLCDFFGVQYNSEIAWYMNNVYLAHGFRDLNFTELDHLSQRDILPVMSTLRHNEFFEGVIDRSGKMAPEFIEELGFVLNTSQSLKKLELTNCAFKPENLVRLSVALKNNPRSVLTHLDLSDNAIDDKSMESFGAAVEVIPHGLQHLKLTNCKITTRGGSLLANSMKQNKNMQYTLVYFDLSGNPLGPDPQGALGFIQEPQTIATLNLSQCNLNFEFVVPVLNRGCQQHLRTLDLSGNAGKGKRGVHGASVGAGFEQFVKSAIAISSVNLSNCKLNGDVISSLLEGLTVNPNITGFSLDVSNNELGVSRDPQQFAKVLSRTNCLRQINLSSSGLDGSMPEVMEAIANNTMLRHVFIGRNFNSKPPVRAAALKRLVSLLMKEDCHIQSLCVDDSKLKEQTSVILKALDENSSLRKLNISGNGMGNHGARSLAKTLLTNTYLTEVEWDRNETGPQGFSDVAAALEHNYTLQVMPLPLYDISKSAGRVEDSVQRIQTYLCRNHSDERLKVELAARHRHRLLTATQQSSVVSRELAQLEDLLEWATSNHGNDHKDVVFGQQTKEQAYVVLKVADGLYSPQVESDQIESITAQVRDLINSFMDRMFTEQVEEPSEQMVTRSMKACPNLLTQQSQETLQSLVMHSQDRDYQYVKKAVAKKTAPEIINHISAINLDTAANISELLVEQILAKLDQANQSLVKLKKAAKSNSQTPDTKVSRNFTFRVQEDQSPTKKKKRVRRPDNDEDEIDLPSTPLVTEGPALQHLGKTRPKPARMQQSTRRRPQRPIVKPAVDTPIEEEATPKPAEKPPEPQPKPKAKPLLPKMKSVEEPVTLTKYEPKPEERVDEVKKEQPKPEEPKAAPKAAEVKAEEVKPEVKPKEVKVEEVKPKEVKFEEVKVEEVKPKEVKVEESESEDSEEEEAQEEVDTKHKEREAKRKEVKAKLADLKMEDLFKPKPTKTYSEPESESSDDGEPAAAKDGEKEEDREEEVTSSEPSPSPLGAGGDEKKEEPSETSESQNKRLSDEFDKIIASTSSWVSELANGTDDDKTAEKRKEEEPAPSPSNQEPERKDTPVEDIGDGGKDAEEKKEEPAKPETPLTDEVDSKPSQDKPAAESPQPEIKVPKVSPKPKPRGPEAQPSFDGAKKEVSGVEAAVREKTPDGVRGAKESPTPLPKKPRTKTPPPSPRSSVSVKEAKSNISKIFAPKPESDDKSSPRMARLSGRGLSGEWEIVENPNAAKSSPEVARKPPPVASKPKPSAGESSEEQKPTSNNSSPKKVPGMVATVPIGELADVLKGVSLKQAAKDQSSPAPPTGEGTPPPAKKGIPAPAPKPRPKPRPTKKGPSSGEPKPSEQEPNDGTLV